MRSTSSRRRLDPGGGGGGAPVTLRSTAQAAEGDGAATLSVSSTAAGVAAGDVVILAACSDDAAPTTASSFTEIDSGTATGLVGCKVFQKTAGGSEPTNYVANYDSTVDVAAGVLSVGGAATATLTVSAATGTGTTATAPSVTGVTGGLLVCIFFRRGDATARLHTATAPLTKRADANGDWATLAIATELLAAGGATGTRSATFPISSGWRAVSLVVPPA